ncbi:helix-turn-helix domain-containing protein [Rhodococcus opacus]|uniref:helix-turn-helix domain-containing protein n=1 Tax=Rhodococcus opacus TaxID=37919 RepID=UPI00211DFA66|nr:helix-turn-helix domain-containing protein [Rhodococcus opacus]
MFSSGWCIVVMASPYRVVLTGTDREVLDGWVRAGSTPQRTVLRALIAADGDSNAHIAAELGVCVDTARKWRARFYHRGIEGLTDAPRSPAPAEVFPVGGRRGEGMGLSAPRRA